MYIRERLIACYAVNGFAFVASAKRQAIYHRKQLSEVCLAATFFFNHTRITFALKLLRYPKFRGKKKENKRENMHAKKR